MTPQKRSKFILILGDLLIPLLGYYFWNWNIYFIFLFLFLDLLAYDVLFFFKIRKISTYTTGRVVNRKQIFLIASLLLGLTSIIFIGYTWLFNRILNTTYQEEIIGFLTYEDMGFSQGYILVPLIVLMAYMTYKTEFLLQRQFTAMNRSTLIRAYLTDNLSALILLLGLTGLFFLGIRTEVVYFIVGLLIYVAYKIYSLKKV